VDRTSENVADLYNPADPAVLNLIRSVLKAAGRQGIPAHPCGEMVGDWTFARRLLPEVV